MPFPVPSFLIVIALAASTSVFSQTDSESLQIDQTSVPVHIVEAYGKSMIGRTKYCPPVSDKYVIDTFVRKFLFARQSEINEKAIRDQALEAALEPLFAEIEKINLFLQSHPENSRAAQVYRKQISRVKSDIRDLEIQSGEDYERKTRFRINSQRGLETRKDISDVSKKYIATMLGFSDLYTSKIRDGISPEEIQQRYDRLIAAGDERLVDVHVFKYRSLILKSHDKSNVEKVTGYLKRNASVKEIRSGVYLTAGAMDDTLHWSRLHRLDAVRKDPSRVNIGSTYLEKVPDRIFADVDDVYRLYYIYDKKHYPKISLDEDTLHSSPSSRTLKNEEYEERLQTVGARLRARSVVSDGGVAVYENEHYAVCPRK